MNIKDENILHKYFLFVRVSKETWQQRWSAAKLLKKIKIKI